MAVKTITNVMSTAKGYINSEDNKILSDIAPREASSTASAAYAQGAYLIYNQTLYKTLTAISIGDTLTVGTNIAKTDIATEIMDAQGHLTFDAVPTQNSTNPVYSGGVWSSLQSKANTSDLGTAAALNVAASGNASTTEVVKGDDTRLTDSRNAADVYEWAKASTKPSYTAAEVGAIASTEKGANSGVAELDANGKVPSSQLPSYVDDVIEGYYNTSDGKFYKESTYTTEIPGETGKIYVDLSTEKCYRWGGSAFVEISESLALGETSSTAYAGDKGKANADAITAIKNGSTIDSFGDVETALGGKANTSEMSVTDGTGADADKTTIQLKSGTSATVLKSHQDISGKADLADLAPAFSTSTAYAVGTYVTYNGDLYRCDTAHAAGAWVAADFTAISAMDEVGAVTDAQWTAITALFA